MSTGFRIILDSIPETYCNKLLPDSLTLYSVDAVYGREV